MDTHTHYANRAARAYTLIESMDFINSGKSEGNNSKKSQKLCLISENLSPARIVTDIKIAKEITKRRLLLCSMSGCHLKSVSISSRKTRDIKYEKRNINPNANKIIISPSIQSITTPKLIRGKNHQSNLRSIMLDILFS